MHNADPTPLAIVGLGCLFPKAAGPGWYWANVKHGTDCIGDVPDTHWNPADYFDADPKRPDMTYARRGGFLDAVPFDPLAFGIAPRDIEATDTTQLLGLVAAKQALDDAGVSFAATNGKPAVDRSRVSVILGVTGTLELVIPLGARLGHPKWRKALRDAGVPDEQADDVCARIADQYVPWQENSFPGLLGNVVAGRIANRLDLHGTNCVVDAACASSLSAVHLAALELQTGKADVVVTGGADTFNDIFMFMCFSKTPALSPTGNSRPFDANGDGTILGEGLGMVVLKRLADAERDGDTVYAVLKGIGTSSDGKGNAIYAPSADGQKRCLTDAYTRAGVSPTTIELVEAHGTGTKVGDATEASALHAVFSREARPSGRPWCAIGSVKSQIGHTKAAAGAASLIKACLALHNKVLPPTIKVDAPVGPLAGDSPFYVNAKMRPWLPSPDHPRRAGVSAFGFGGSNFHAVLEEHTPTKTAPDWDGSVEILPMGATAPAVLASAVGQLPADWAGFARAAENARRAFDPAADCRLILVAHRDRTDLPKLFASAKAQLETDAPAWATPDGAFFGRGPAAGGLAVLFPGQGSQQVGMLRDLACLFPEMLDTLAAFGPDVTDRIYPPTSFAPDAKQKEDAALRSTDVAQPAIGAVSFGLWRVLSERFGVEAAVFAGHSYGELPALTAAGRLTPDELVRLSKLRGRLMVEQAAGDAGAMLAAFAPRPELERLIADAGLNVTVANHNAPKQSVLTGPTADIGRATEVLTAAGVRTARLPVAAAFHSPLVAAAAEPFRAELEAVPFPPGRVPVFANTTADPYPDDTPAARDRLGHQLAKPVAFVDQVRAMAAAGAGTFLEVGPGVTLGRLCEQILLDPAACISTDGSGGKRTGVLELAHALARLAARGHAVRLAAWEADSRCRPPVLPAKPGMTVPVCGANAVLPRPARPPRPAAAPPAVEYIPMPEPTPMPDDTVARALAVAQQTLTALQHIQEQTAALHRQFLDGQAQAQQTLAQLVAQQAALFGGAAPLPVAVAPVSMPAPLPPAPVPLPPPPPAVVLTPPPTPVVAPVAPPPVTVPVVVPVPRAVAPSAGRLTDTLLAVVAEKTGYPAEMLDLGMALDADLGIDSIKRVEILSALQDRLPDAPPVRPEHLGTLHTLRDVAEFLSGSAVPEPTPVVAPPAPPVLNPDPPVPGRIEIDMPDALPADSAGLPAGPPMSPAEVSAVLLAVVAEKTGYPAEMLDLGMALDADLGIDSIKRVEILSALQDRLPDAPPVRPEHLGTLHTLRDVAAFLGGPPATAIFPRPAGLLPPADEPPASTSRVPVRAKADATTPPPVDLPPPKTDSVSDLKPQPGPTDSMLGLLVPPPPPAAPARPLPATDDIERSILSAVDLDLTAARARLPLPDGGEVWVVADDEPLARELVAQLQRVGYAAKLHPWQSAGTARPAGPLAGLVLLPPLVVPAALPVNRLGFQWVQAVGPRLRPAKPGGAVLACVTRLDGAFGLASLSAQADPTPGGLAGIVKTVRHEWPELACKAIDLLPAFAADAPAAAAQAVYEELLLAGPIEVGVAPSHRCTLELARTVRRAGSAPPVSFGPQDVILVTGGARGVTAEAAVALAEAFRPTLVLTGRTPRPDGPEPAWLAGLTDEASIKKAIADQLGTAASPKAVGDQFAKLSAQREIRQTLARLEGAGAKAAYYPVNAAGGRAVADLLHQVKVKYGPITAVVHGAGVLADRKIEALTPDQFDYVYGTKVDGGRLLLDLLSAENLKAVVLFSSTTARLGRTGQLAYAAANEVLNKVAQVEARRRPTARVVAVNWGPWDGGMVTPGLRKLFEAEGVGLVPMDQGGAFVVHELTAPTRAVEVVALGRPARGSGVTVPSARPTAAPTSPPPPATVAGPPLTTGPGAEVAAVFERAVDIPSHPVLRSHVLDGRAVLPMALHMEWLAHAALHGNPGLVFHGFNDLRITSGVMVEDGQPAQLRLMAGKAVKQDKLFAVPVEVRGRRRDGREVIHSRAEVVLTAALPKPPAAGPAPEVPAYPHPTDEVYRYFLFHGPDLHGIESVDGCGETAFVGTAYPAPAPAEWFTTPLRAGWVADPLVLDAAFQMMILWSFAQHGAGSLPCFLGRYRQYRRAFPAGPTRVNIRVTRDNGSFARAEIDFLDADGAVVAQVQDYECVIDPMLNQAFRRNQLGPLVKQ